MIEWGLIINWTKRNKRQWNMSQNTIVLTKMHSKSSSGECRPFCLGLKKFASYCALVLLRARCRRINFHFHWCERHDWGNEFSAIASGDCWQLCCGSLKGGPFKHHVLYTRNACTVRYDPLSHTNQNNIKRTANCIAVSWPNPTNPLSVIFPIS